MTGKFIRISKPEECHYTGECTHIVFYAPDNEWECVRADGIGTECWDAKEWQLVEVK